MSNQARTHLMSTFSNFLSKLFPNKPSRRQVERNIDMSTIENLETITLGGGCFWCLEAVYLELNGVVQVVSGYAGGEIDNPSYQAVCSGTTGHAEIVQVHFDADVVSVDDILRIFYTIHDPTTLNRQGADVGTQYRSVIFYHDDDQKEAAERIQAEIEAAAIWSDPIVTELSPLPTVYEAEAYHQNYYANNPGAGYCRFVIAPKVSKFRKQYYDRLVTQ